MFVVTVVMIAGRECGRTWRRKEERKKEAASTPVIIVYIVR